MTTPADRIAAGARYTKRVVSRHRVMTNALAKMAKLQAEASANVHYELITDPDTPVMAARIYCYTVDAEPSRDSEVTPSKDEIIDRLLTAIGEYGQARLECGLAESTAGVLAATIEEDRVHTEIRSLIAQLAERPDLLDTRTPADRILDAIRANATVAGWASLAAIREDAGLTRPDFDATMRQLAISGAVVLVPEDNQKTLRQADESAALHIGGEDKHLAQIA